MQRLTTTDAGFVYGESVSGPMHISGIYTFEGEIAFSTIHHHIAARLHKIPAYRKKLAPTPLNLAHPVWIDDPEFNLDNHLEHVELPPDSTMDDAVATAAQLNEAMLDRDKPLWKVYVLSGVADRTVLLMCTHHAMIDGASGIELLAIIFDFDKDYDPQALGERFWQAEPEPSALDLLRTAFSENMEKLRNTELSSLIPSASNSRELLGRAARIMSSFVSKPAILAPFNAGLVGPERQLRWMQVPFGEIREIRRAMGGTINDVVLTVVSEGVARYLRDQNVDTSDESMRIMCPVNVRTEDKKGALGNQVSAIFPMLPAWPMGVTQRLATVIAEMERIKGNSEAQAITMLQESVPEPWPLALWPTQLVGTAYDPTAIAARMPQPAIPAGLKVPNFGFNFVCTNVPGSQVPQYLCGHELIDHIGVLLLSGNLGLGTTITSYNKRLYFSFNCEPKLMPQVELLASHARDSFDELLASARNRAAALSA